MFRGREASRLQAPQPWQQLMTLGLYEIFERVDILVLCHNSSFGLFVFRFFRYSANPSSRTFIVIPSSTRMHVTPGKNMFKQIYFQTLNALSSAIRVNKSKCCDVPGTGGGQAPCKKDFSFLCRCYLQLSSGRPLMESPPHYHAAIYMYRC